MLFNFLEIKKVVLSCVMTMELDGEIFAIHPQRDIHAGASAPNRAINRPRSGLVFTVIWIPPHHDDRMLV
jgi:mannose-6-phosphate isomerase-like protein (cupin superfamily)